MSACGAGARGVCAGRRSRIVRILYVPGLAARERPLQNSKAQTPIGIGVPRTWQLPRPSSNAGRMGRLVIRCVAHRWVNRYATRPLNISIDGECFNAGLWARGVPAVSVEELKGDTIRSPVIYIGMFFCI